MITNDEYFNPIACELERLRAEIELWRDKALDVEKHPVVVALLRERDEARAEVKRMQQQRDQAQHWLDEFQGYVAERDVAILQLHAEIARLRTALHVPDEVLRQQQKCDCDICGDLFAKLTKLVKEKP